MSGMSVDYVSRHVEDQIMDDLEHSWNAHRDFVIELFRLLAGIRSNDNTALFSKMNTDQSVREMTGRTAEIILREHRIELNFVGEYLSELHRLSALYDATRQAGHAGGLVDSGFPGTALLEIHEELRALGRKAYPALIGILKMLPASEVSEADARSNARRNSRKKGVRRVETSGL